MHLLMSDFECSDFSVVLCCAVRVLQVHIEQHFWCDRFSYKHLLMMTDDISALEIF